MRGILVAAVGALLAGCGTRPIPEAAREIAVVWVVAGPAADAARLEAADWVVRGIPGIAISLYGVSSVDDARRMLKTLVARGDSLIVGVGRPMREVMWTQSGRRHDWLWIGFDDPGPREALFRAWWAPTESLRTEVARRAAESRMPVRVLGSTVPGGVLRVLKESGAQIRPTGRASAFRTGLVPSPGEVILMLDHEPVPPGTQNLYWACESPFLTPPEAEVALRMDWPGALAEVIRWRLGRGGVPPGPTLGPWLSMDAKTDEVG